VAGRRSAGLSGRYAPSAALDRLLAGSGLIWSETRPGVIYLRRAAVGASAETADQVADVIVTGTLLKTSGELASPVLVLDRNALDRRGLGTVADILQDLPQNYAGAGNATAALTGSIAPDPTRSMRRASISEGWAERDPCARQWPPSRRHRVPGGVR
jgi:iron complex outermembrane receptor protein